ncbi:MAG: 50S ribosomal protein L18 [Candidatus Levybacteria bacterium RIFOXYA1_FULL_41_10]|nr:MAG: 50S ribosomal protein L18 [Candidatus Levybacteria bacterium GW2011_GWA1_39_34]KKR50653.1 MAG: 50S ribosomal protein L18 [Candidatus Levybacteria bacterium GW2011_GWC1_40_19]KKR72532.1 MAG: 50S ribosomal protein L18 [Candidatus Levybacteria bacterium GW2011_GWC2_40_7]KKR95338.1 MAG: 50S ribosomal protein L18 [Candidatus Levybacteria bacterium GW2011_GWA2_41_15]KKS01853.1 MAG: 50S ribosomal protein L18 [Candidatus Levybacteria bacterium GW2011_GWB1_41_21]OGH20230.1 MAG: 50S ribosomal pr
MKDKKLSRQRRTRAKLFGTQARPRLSVFRSNKHVFAQLIDDSAGKTILGVSEIKVKTVGKTNKTERAKALGKYISEKAKDKKIKKIVFDRGSYSYHGRVKAIAEGLREGGLKF